MPYLSYAEDFDGVADVFLRDPNKYMPVVEFLENLLRKPSELSSAERELIGAYVSTLNNCQFCIGSHVATAKAFNVDEKVLEALNDNIETSAIDSKLKPVLLLVKKLTESSNKLVQGDIKAVVSAGWSEQTVEDIIGITAIFAFLNRFVDGFGLTGTDDYFDMVGQGLSHYGYEPFIRSALEQAS